MEVCDFVTFSNYFADNKIEEMFGMEACRRLTHLSLAHNKLNKIQGIEHLPIKHLNLVGTIP